jgi:hypothetical protein
LFREAGVETEGITVPDIDGRIREGFARARVEYDEAKIEGDAGLPFDDAGAQ